MGSIIQLRRPDGRPFFINEKNLRQMNWTTADEAGISHEKLIAAAAQAKEKEQEKKEEPASIRNDAGVIVPALLADELQNQFIFKAMRDNGEIYFFNSKFYEPAETMIDEKIRELTGNDYKTFLVKETTAAIRAASYCDRTSPNNLICLENCLFDMKTMQPQPFSAEHFITIKIPISYNASADCPAIKKFLSEIVENENDRKTLRQAIGYCYTAGYPIQKAIMLVGEGDNGKSTYLCLTEAALGKENVCNISLQELSDSGNRFARGWLYGKAANIYADLPDAALRYTGAFKMLTGGDTINADIKFKKNVKFQNRAKLLFSCNKLPEARDTTPAFFRRWIIINFPFTFSGEKADKNLIEKLTTPQELSGLFNLAIAAAKELLENGKFASSISTEKMQHQYERMSNSLLAFINDYVVPAATECIAKEKFYNSYVKYCQNEKLPAKSKIMVGRELPEHIAVIEDRPVIDGRQQKAWRGITFRGKKSLYAGKQKALGDDFEYT